MEVNLLKRLFICSLVIWIVLIFGGCDEWITWNTIEISGTVTITRNGEPWIHDSLIDTLKTETSARMQPPMPPYARPAIRAFRSSGGMSIGSNYSLSQPPLNNDDLALGKYTWTVELVNVFSVPEIIFFEVEIPMAGLYPNKMTHGIRIGSNHSAIDLGVIDFDVIRLWGNLPVTINGEQPTEGTYIYIKNEDGSYLTRASINRSNGNWIQDIYSQDSEIPITFTLRTRKSGGVFDKVLNPNHIITIHDADKEIIFPDYPHVDFEAFTLSGTIEIIFARERYWLAIEFFDADYSDNSLIGVVDLVSWQIPKDENGLSKWETMVPAFSFPKTLNLKVQNKFDSSIEITEDTDLSNIYLGSFPDY